MDVKLARRPGAVILVLAAILAQVAMGAGWTLAARRVLGGPIDRLRRRPLDGG